MKLLQSPDSRRTGRASSVDDEVGVPVIPYFVVRILTDLLDTVAARPDCRCRCRLAPRSCRRCLPISTRAAVNVRNLIAVRVPFGLIPEQQVNELEIVILRQAARHRFGGDVHRAQRETPGRRKRPCPVSIYSCLELREDVHVEMGAMRAGGRGIFDHDQTGPWQSPGAVVLGERDSQGCRRGGWRRRWKLAREDMK